MKYKKLSEQDPNIEVSLFCKISFFYKKTYALMNFLQYFNLFKALAGYKRLKTDPFFARAMNFFVNEVKKGYVFRGCFDYV